MRNFSLGQQLVTWCMQQLAVLPGISNNAVCEIAQQQEYLPIPVPDPVPKLG